MSAYDVVFSALTADAGLMAIVPAERIQRYYVRDEVPNPSIAYYRNGTAYHETIHGRALGADVTFAIVLHADTEEGIDLLGDTVEQVEGLRPLDREDDPAPTHGLYSTIITVEILKNF